jgi:hypothetical protein
VSKGEYELARTLANIHNRQCDVPTPVPVTEELDVKEHKTETEV